MKEPRNSQETQRKRGRWFNFKGVDLMDQGKESFKLQPITLALREKRGRKKKEKLIKKKVNSMCTHQTQEKSKCDTNHMTHLLDVYRGFDFFYLEVDKFQNYLY